MEKVNFFRRYIARGAGACSQCQAHAVLGRRQTLVGCKPVQRKGFCGIGGSALAAQNTVANGLLRTRIGLCRSGTEPLQCHDIVLLNPQAQGIQLTQTQLSVCEPLVGGFLVPTRGIATAAQDALTFVKKLSEPQLRGAVPLLGSLLVPATRQGRVSHGALALLVHLPQRMLGQGVALGCSGVVQAQSAGSIACLQGHGAVFKVARMGTQACRQQGGQGKSFLGHGQGSVRINNKGQL